MNELKLIYIGDEFYDKSGTIMSPLYEETGERSDWGFVNVALRKGKTVIIRPANNQELSNANKALATLLERRQKDD